MPVVFIFSFVLFMCVVRCLLFVVLSPLRVDCCVLVVVVVCVCFIVCRSSFVGNCSLFVVCCLLVLVVVFLVC